MDDKAGSPEPNEPAFLVLGKLRRAHGVTGEVALDVYSNLPELLAVNGVVYIGDTYQPFQIKATRQKGNLLLLKLDGVDDRTTASELTNALLYIKTNQLPPLPEDDYYLHQLIGLDVYDSEGCFLGILTEILETGANDVYLVKDELGNEVLIPAVEEFIINVDLDADKMVVTKMKWYGEGD